MPLRDGFDSIKGEFPVVNLPHFRLIQYFFSLLSIVNNNGGPPRIVIRPQNRLMWMQLYLLLHNLHIFQPLAISSPTPTAIGTTRAGSGFPSGRLLWRASAHGDSMSELLCSIRCFLKPLSMSSFAFSTRAVRMKNVFRVLSCHYGQRESATNEETHSSSGQSYFQHQFAVSYT